MGYVCGKCRSKGLYRDDHFSVGDYAIVCPICGNRFYPGAGRLAAGIAPVMTNMEAKAAKPAVVVSGHFKQERTANILTGQARLAAEKRIKKGEIEMASKKPQPCENCGRIKSIVGGGFCWSCYRAAKGRDGDNRTAALAEIKARINRGEIKQGVHGKKKTSSAAPKARVGESSSPLPPARTITADDVDYRTATLTEPRSIPVIVKLTIEVGIRLVQMEGLNDGIAAEIEAEG